MAIQQAGIGSSPAVIEARIAGVGPIRTDHRLRIREIVVSPGQRVKAGELLVQMDTSEVDADLAIAKAKLAYIEITAGWQQLRMLDNKARTSQSLSANAERAALDVARIIATAEHDRAALAQLDVNLDVERKLVGDQLANAAHLRSLQLERAALAKKVDEYQAAVARARKSAGGASQRLGDWRHELDGPTASAGAPDARTVACELQRKEIAKLELFRKLHEVRAPFDGRVGGILQRVGELSADPVSPVLTIVEERSSTAIAYLDQRSAHKVHVGDRVKLVPRDLSGAALKGRVVALAPNITEVPIRFRRAPTLPEFCRNVYVALDVPAELPGQAYDAVFRRGDAR
jgi:multidrug resistance efflux pump